MNEKAIEAAAKTLSICNECSGDGFDDDDGNDCPRCFGCGTNIRAAIEAYEAALWRPIDEAPKELRLAVGPFSPTHFRYLPAAPEGGE